MGLAVMVEEHYHLCEHDVSRFEANYFSLSLSCLDQIIPT